MTLLDPHRDIVLEKAATDPKYTIQLLNDLADLKIATMWNPRRPLNATRYSLRGRPLLNVMFLRRGEEPAAPEPHFLVSDGGGYIPEADLPCPGRVFHRISAQAVYEEHDEPGPLRDAALRAVMREAMAWADEQLEAQGWVLHGKDYNS